MLGRFRDETKLLYRLSQGCLDIVRCIGSGELTSPVSGEITPYMILEWLDGKSLSQDLKDRREQGKRPRTLEEVVNLLDSAAMALAFAHDQGVVHRDIKPGNLFFTQTANGVRLKVLDFGLAKIFDDEALGVRPSVETGVGVAMCSPSYGAPEQFSSSIGPVGPWTDVYSLTLVLLELMRGEKVRPAGNLAEGLLSAIDPERGSPRASQLGLNVSRNVEDLLHRALALKPLERPRDVGVFWNALKELVKQTHMAATVLDGNVTDAMDQVRAAQAAKLAQQRQTQPTPSGAPSAVPSHQTPRGLGPPPKPIFAGTMLLANSPMSNVPLPAPTPTPETKPMAGAPQPALSTAPLAPVLRPPQQAMGGQTSQAPHPSMKPSAKASAVPAPKSGGSLLSAVFVFLAIVFVGGGGVLAYWYFRLRGH